MPREWQGFVISETLGPGEFPLGVSPTTDRLPADRPSTTSSLWPFEVASCEDLPHNGGVVPMNATDSGKLGIKQCFSLAVRVKRRRVRSKQGSRTPKICGGFLQARL
jgi:hypothetical protein